jgi:hypothetical protein
VTRVVVRYRVRPECAELNEELVREVFAALATTDPDGFCYQSMVLADGVTFVHVVDGDSAGLVGLPAFQRFASTVGERCEDPPEQTTARLIGSFDGRTP